MAVTKNTSVAIKAAWIAGIFAVVAAVCSAVLPSIIEEPSTFNFLPGQAVSMRELSKIITDRWRRVDGFLADVSLAAELDSSERNELGTFREQIRSRHESHARALEQGDAVLAHERLRDLRASLDDVDKRLAALRLKYPTLPQNVKTERREFWKEGVSTQVVYQEKKEGFWEQVQRALAVVWK